MSKTVLTIADYRDTQPEIDVHLSNSSATEKIDFNTVSAVDLLFDDGTRQTTTRSSDTTSDIWHGTWQYSSGFTAPIKTNVCVVLTFTDSTIMTVNTDYVLEVGKAY